MRAAFGNQMIELLAQPRQHRVIAEATDLPVALLEIHGRWPAPQAEIRVVGLSRPIHPTTHDGDGDAVLRRIGGQLAYLLRQVDEAIILDARAAWTGNDVETLAE